MVKWSEPSKDDLRQIFDFILRDSRYYAEQVISEIIEKAEAIFAFPQSGRIVPELSDENIREIFVFSYRIIYEIYPEMIYIHAVIHGKRDFDNAFKDRG